jgi:hypothetical protein
MSFKPYSSSVLVGNWYEDVQLEQVYTKSSWLKTEFRSMYIIDTIIVMLKY